MGDERLAQVIARLEHDDMVEFVEWLDEERREPVVALLPEAQRAELLTGRAVSAFDSAGRVMTTRFLALDEGVTAQQAIEAIREAGDDAESILYLYVVDGKERLRGVVPLRRLVAASPDRRCGELMVQDPVSVHPEADQEEVAQIVARYNLLAVPVVDGQDRILGVITVDDVIEVITEEATEDMYHLAGLSDEDRVFSPAHHAIRKRLPWMLLNLAATFLLAWVIGLFERTLEQIVTLAFFMPVVAGMGGNGGIQALTVITRAIALGELEFSSGFRAIGKEVNRDRHHHGSREWHTRLPVAGEPLPRSRPLHHHDHHHGGRRNHGRRGAPAAQGAGAGPRGGLRRLPVAGEPLPSSDRVYPP